MLRAVGGGLLILLVLALLASAAGWVYAARRLEATPVDGLAAAVPGGPTNVLVVHTGSAASVEPVSVVLLQLRSPSPPRALVMPLDLEVTRPGAEPAPVRALLGSGGLDGLVAAVTDYTGIAVHRLIRLNVDGLESLAALAEGPSCPAGDCLAEEVATIRREGVVPLALLADHAATLQHAAGDLTRPSLLASPLKVKRIVDAASAAVATDVDLGPRNAVRFAGGLADADLERLDIRAVPGFHDPASGLTIPYWEQAETIFQAFRQGSELPEGVGETDPAEELLVPEEVRVLVLNGIGVEGLAGRVADHLRDGGFDVVGADNAEPFDESLAATVVAHRPDRAHEGDLVAAELDGASVEERTDLPRGADVVVTVGRDWVER